MKKILLEALPDLEDLHTRQKASLMLPGTLVEIKMTKRKRTAAVAAK